MLFVEKMVSKTLTNKPLIMCGLWTLIDIFVRPKFLIIWLHNIVFLRLLKYEIDTIIIDEMNKQISRHVYNNNNFSKKMYIIINNEERAKRRKRRRRKKRIMPAFESFFFCSLMLKFLFQQILQKQTKAKVLRTIKDTSNYV